MMRRRRFLQSLTVCASYPALSACTSLSGREAVTLTAGTYRTAQGAFEAQVWADRENILQTVLPGRAHALSFRPQSQELLVFSRRPGTWVQVFDLSTAKRMQTISASSNRHFYGHGAFSADGNWLYTSENDFESGVGKIGVRDARNHYEQIAEFPSFGVGPHEMVFSTFHDALIVANGGIQTHPDTGRAKLNLDSMHSNLAFIDPLKGTRIRIQSLPEEYRLTSLRHLDVNVLGDVIIGGQEQEGTKKGNVLFFSNQSESLTVLDSPDYNGYVGSVAFDRSGNLFAASSPRSGAVSIYNAWTGRVVRRVLLNDVCGVTAHQTHRTFTLSSGSGVVMMVTADERDDLVLSNNAMTRWDNHLSLAT